MLLAVLIGLNQNKTKTKKLIKKYKMYYCKIIFQVFVIIEINKD
jgi:hypothetical protein